MNAGTAVPSRRAFTLLELVVVVVLVAIVAGMVVPRLLDTGSRRADAAADSVRLLLSVAAHREALGGRRLAIEWEQERGSIRLLSLRSGSSGRAEWAPDPLSPEAAIDPLTLRTTLVNGSALDARAWRIELPRHEPRGQIDIVLERAGPARAPDRWLVSLAPDADAATMSRDATESGVHSRAIDLDAGGMGQQTW